MHGSKALGSDDGSDARSPSGLGPASADPLANLAFAALRGDESATTELLRGVAPAMLGVIRSTLGPASPDVQDALQESLAIFVPTLGRFRFESSVKQFARGVALRKCLELRRREISHRRKLQVFSSALGSEPGLDPDLLREYRLRRLRELLDELPEDQAETLALRVMVDWTIDEIAERMEVSRNTVRSRLRLAKEKLRDRLTQERTLQEAASDCP